MCQMRPSIFTCVTVHFEYKESFFRLSLHCLKCEIEHTFIANLERFLNTVLNRMSIKWTSYWIFIYSNFWKSNLAHWIVQDFPGQIHVKDLKSYSRTELGRGGLTKAIRGIWVRTPSLKMRVKTIRTRPITDYPSAHLWFDSGCLSWSKSVWVHV